MEPMHLPAHQSGVRYVRQVNMERQPTKPFVFLVCQGVTALPWEVQAVIFAKNAQLVHTLLELVKNGRVSHPTLPGYSKALSLVFTT
jgi:hypothetical protein